MNDKCNTMSKLYGGNEMKVNSKKVLTIFAVLIAFGGCVSHPTPEPQSMGGAGFAMRMKKKRVIK